MTLAEFYTKSMRKVSAVKDKFHDAEQHQYSRLDWQLIEAKRSECLGRAGLLQLLRDEFKNTSLWNSEAVPDVFINDLESTNFSRHFHTLEKLHTLPGDWHPDGIATPHHAALYFAREALEILKGMNFSPTKIAASAEEGVGISFLAGDKYADIEFFNSGEILAVISNRHGKPEAWEIGMNNIAIQHALEKIRDYLQP